MDVERPRLDPGGRVFVPPLGPSASYSTGGSVPPPTSAPAPLPALASSSMPAPSPEPFAPASATSPTPVPTPSPSPSVPESATSSSSASAPTPASASSPAPALASALPMPPPAAAPLFGCFGQVYGRRLVHIHDPQYGPTRFGGSSGGASVSLSPPSPPVGPMTSTDPPPAAIHHLTRLQSGTIQPVNYRLLHLQLPLLFQVIIAVHVLIPTGPRRWLMSSRHWSTMVPGDLYLVLLCQCCDWAMALES
jgi:hypothetical protein